MNEVDNFFYNNKNIVVLPNVNGLLVIDDINDLLSKQAAALKLGSLLIIGCNKNKLVSIAGYNSNTIFLSHDQNYTKAFSNCFLDAINYKDNSIMIIETFYDSCDSVLIIVIFQVLPSQNTINKVASFNLTLNSTAKYVYKDPVKCFIKEKNSDTNEFASIFYGNSNMRASVSETIFCFTLIHYFWKAKIIRIFPRQEGNLNTYRRP